ncbi:protein rogdi homolog isoform X3 [Physella acuta]|uniref:protein rogdi homolog isoform X1 n=1 Tax=Physella acuta TaxID=109671 RepID=UPI0027DDA3C0|nr:protein rogdi homolog isoform X1 [Physella acuta]XP_059141139.1 protein rogdi homolog isoform X2 [Physella acuta]XP_059141140.1 protein rogdi homolog isoform X3 [Physella acuta]
MAKSAKVDAELEVLRKELNWLLKEEVNPVLQDIRETLQECYDCLPFHGTAEKSARHEELTPLKILLTSPSGSSMNCKSVVTLRGDSVEAAEVQFKHKQGKEHNLFKTKLKDGCVWRLPQIRDTGNHLCNALEIVSRSDPTYIYKSVKEVFLILDELMESLMKCRQSLSLPKRKSINELMDNQNLLVFNPPLPSDIAISFYIHTSKLVLALYCLHNNGQHKIEKLEITQRIQVEAMVKWLNEAIIFFTLSLQQCQQLKDKLLAVAQILEDP